MSQPLEKWQIDCTIIAILMVIVAFAILDDMTTPKPKDEDDDQSIY